MKSTHTPNQKEYTQKLTSFTKHTSAKRKYRSEFYKSHNGPIRGYINITVVEIRRDLLGIFIQVLYSSYTRDIQVLMK